MELSSTARTAQALGITASLISSGVYLASSALAITPLLPLPINESTRIFASIYDVGKQLQVPLAATAVLGNAFAAYLTESAVEFGTAAALSAGAIGFTVAYMMPGIQRLLSVSELDGSKIQAVQKHEVVHLLVSWQKQNYVRVVMALVAGALGLYAITKPIHQRQGSGLKRL